MYRERPIGVVPGERDLPAQSEPAFRNAGSQTSHAYGTMVDKSDVYESHLPRLPLVLRCEFVESVDPFDFVQLEGVQSKERFKPITTL